MKTVSHDEAAHCLDELLDEVLAGESCMITRNGRTVAVPGPVPGSGTEVAALLTWSVDEDFARDVAAATGRTTS